MDRLFLKLQGRAYDAYAKIMESGRFVSAANMINRWRAYRQRRFGIR